MASNCDNCGSRDGECALSLPRPAACLAPGVKPRMLNVGAQQFAPGRFVAGARVGVSLGTAHRPGRGGRGRCGWQMGIAGEREDHAGQLQGSPPGE
jgi:hypothetical protein